ncbi:MAG: MmgE/PrpD family protein [Rubrobacteraceae bacterium]
MFADRVQNQPQVEAKDSLVSGLHQLGEFVVSFDWEANEDLHEPLVKTLLDTLGTMVAGAHTEEVQALVSAWEPDPGPAKLFGTGRHVTTEAAAYLNGVSTVTLELDEGNKYARGHAACHVFPAALAVAQARNVSGPELGVALLAGYEVASRFGRATRLKAGVHPHGNWGVVGAAAAVSRLMRLDARRTSGALDFACETVLATPFESALIGSPARDGWVGTANLSGIAAARAAAAGLACTNGMAGITLGSIVGEFDPAELTVELGRRFDITSGYFKRHASCSYTHPPADAVLDILQEHPNLQPDRIKSILVETHSIAATLDRTSWTTRLAAMFSLPYVVGAALVTGGCSPQAFDHTHRKEPAIGRLAQIARIVDTDEFNRRLPEERGARVTLALNDGSELAAEVPNPVGDTAYHPFGIEDIRKKLGTLLAPESFDPERLEELAWELLEAEEVSPVLERAP